MQTNTINTDTRIFKVLTFDNEMFLCNLNHISTNDVQNIKKLWHLWDFTFKPFGKKDLKDMIKINSSNQF